MKILVSGSTGLVGSHLVTQLREAGHEVIRLVRASSPADAKETAVAWDPDGGTLDTSDLEGVDGVVHLAGENVARGRWTVEKKARIRDSRVKGTRLLCEALARLETPPKVLVCASAIGLYGDRGDDLMRETSEPETGFLASVCREWESAAQPAIDAGIRVVTLRIGLVLSATGGALAKMLGPFRLGLGGVMGNGRQFMSWITIDDISGVILRALTDESIAGPVNGVAPHPVTNREFTKTLGRALSRPTIVPLPAFACRLMFGEMGKELLLASTRVKPGVLEEAGYAFRHPDLETALRALL